MNRRKLSAGLVVGAMALLGLGVTGGVAQAAPPALPGPSVFTLPLPVPLAVTVTTGPGGAITDVSVGAVDPAVPVAPVADPAAPIAAPTGEPITVSKARPGKVVFTTEADGVKVSIRSKGQTQTLTARAATIDAFLNTAGGSWTGEVFPGVQAVVPYIIGGDAAAPTITVGAITGGGEAADPVTKVDDDGEEISVRVVVTFTSPDKLQTRDLSIRLKVENESDDDDDDDSPENHASLSITLGKIRGVPGAESAGEGKTWGGILCDGTPATITFDVDADGNVSNVVPSVTGEVKAEGGKASVRFATGERIKISVKTEAGGLTINFGEKIRCRDAAAPTIDSLPADVVSDDNGDHDDDHDGDHHGGGDQGGRHGGGGDDDKKSDD